MQTKKIGNTEFNVEAIKEMSYEQFNKTYSKILKGSTTKAAFEALKQTEEPTLKEEAKQPKKGK